MSRKSSAASRPSQVTREAVAAQIAARLAGHLSDASLASWAFESFYDVESELATLEPGFESLLADALDALMFHDEPSFRLTEDALRALAERLTPTG